MDTNKLLQAYKKAFEIRSIERMISINYKKGYMRCPTHLSIGQELVPSILYLFNSNDDLAVSTHRSHAHYLGKGGSIEKFFDELHGLPTGCSGGKGGSMHLIDLEVGFMGSTAIVGNTIPVGVGLAESQKLSKTSHLTYIFLGDGASEEGVFYESLSYACVREIPCIFVIENNQYSVYTDLQPRQGHLSIKDKFKGFNIKYVSNYDNDFKNLLIDWEQTVNYVRSYSKPAILEVQTFRELEHCGPNNDDYLGYRSKNLIEKWNSLDILDLYKKNLLEDDFSEIMIKNLEESILNNIEEKFNISLSKRIEYSSNV